MSYSSWLVAYCIQSCWWRVWPCCDISDTVYWIRTCWYRTKLSTGYGVAMPNTSLIAVTKPFHSRALAVCIQGTNEEGFLDVFLTLELFPHLDWVFSSLTKYFWPCGRYEMLHCTCTLIHIQNNWSVLILEVKRFRYLLWFSPQLTSECPFWCELRAESSAWLWLLVSGH